MSNLTFSNWTSGFKAGLTAQQFQAFQALIQTSPLLVDLLNTFSKEGGSVDASGGVSTYFSPEQISASLRKDICQKSRVQSTPTTYSRSIVSAQKNALISGNDARWIRIFVRHAAMDSAPVDPFEKGCQLRRCQ